MSYSKVIRENFASHLAVVRSSLEQLLPAMENAADVLLGCYRSGGKAIFLGNGGSAADAQHLAAEFLGRYLKNRRPLPAMALHTNTSALTAIANDFGYEQVFMRQIQALAAPSDVVIGLSTSGNSLNVLAALRWAKEQSLATIGFTGPGGGALREFTQVLLAIPDPHTPRIQECHLLIGHILCEIIEQQLC